jgi:hypothetical protein
MENVSSEKSRHPLFFLGIEAAPIQNVVIANCTFKNADKPSVVEFVDQLVLKNVTQPLD